MQLIDSDLLGAEQLLAATTRTEQRTDRKRVRIILREIHIESNTINKKDQVQAEFDDDFNSKIKSFMMNP